MLLRLGRFLSLETRGMLVTSMLTMSLSADIPFCLTVWSDFYQSVIRCVAVLFR